MYIYLLHVIINGLLAFGSICLIHFFLCFPPLRPWGWDAIKANAGFIVQFGSQDDPFIPWNEQASVHEGLGTEMHEFEDK